MTRSALTGWPQLLATCALACHPAYPEPASSAADGSKASTDVGGGADPGRPPEDSVALPPPPPRSPEARDRSCKTLGKVSRFCQENRRDWARVLLRWKPESLATQSQATAPEERLLTSRWLERSVHKGLGDEGSGSVAAESPSAPVCDGAWLCLWTEPSRVGPALEATLSALSRPHVGEFYLARLDAAAAWEEASLGPSDPRALSTARLLGSPRGRRFSSRDTLTVQDLSYSVGAPWIRRMDLGAASGQLKSLLGAFELELAGPLTPTVRHSAERTVSEWSAEQSSPPESPVGRSIDTTELPRLVEVEDEAARNGRLVLTLPLAPSGHERVRRWRSFLANVRIPAAVRSVVPEFPRDDQWAREFVGTRSELEAIVAQLSGPTDVQQKEPAEEESSWLGVLWAPAPVEPDSPEDGPESP